MTALVANASATLQTLLTQLDSAVERLSPRPQTRTQTQMQTQTETQDVQAPLRRALHADAAFSTASAPVPVLALPAHHRRAAAPIAVPRRPLASAAAKLAAMSAPVRDEIARVMSSAAKIAHTAALIAEATSREREGAAAVAAAGSVTSLPVAALPPLPIVALPPPLQLPPHHHHHHEHAGRHSQRRPRGAGATGAEDATSTALLASRLSFSVHRASARPLWQQIEQARRSAGLTAVERMHRGVAAPATYSASSALLAAEALALREAHGVSGAHVRRADGRRFSAAEGSLPFLVQEAEDGRQELLTGHRTPMSRNHDRSSGSRPRSNSVSSAGGLSVGVAGPGFSVRRTSVSTAGVSAEELRWLAAEQAAAARGGLALGLAIGLFRPRLFVRASGAARLALLGSTLAGWRRRAAAVIDVRRRSVAGQLKRLTQAWRLWAVTRRAVTACGKIVQAVVARRTASTAFGAWRAALAAARSLRRLDAIAGGVQRLVHALALVDRRRVRRAFLSWRALSRTLAVLAAAIRQRVETVQRRGFNVWVRRTAAWPERLLGLALLDAAASVGARSAGAGYCGRRAAAPCLGPAALAQRHCGEPPCSAPEEARDAAYHEWPLSHRLRVAGRLRRASPRLCDNGSPASGRADCGECEAGSDSVVRPRSPCCARGAAVDAGD